MTHNKHALWIVVALSAAVLVPLYGDPRRSPVTHSEWARMMMRSLGFEDNLPTVENADDIFKTLAWKDQRTVAASRYKRGTGVERRGVFVDAGAEAGETAYNLPIVRNGDYNVRLRLRGAPDEPFQVDIRKDGQLDVVEKMRPTGNGDEYTSVDLGWVKMAPGNHTVSVGLPPGTSLEEVQVSPPCLSPIEPEYGWRAPALTTDEDLALTMLQALELEDELPPADEPIELRAGRFQRLSPGPEMRTVASESEEAELRGTRDGVHAIVYADIVDPGLYSVSVWTSEGDGQTWLADSCRRADVCPAGNLTPRWRTLLTSEFNAGRHSFAVLLTSGARVGRLRLQRLKTGPDDFVDALKRVGFDVGPKGPITREKAREAMEWLRGRWKQRLEEERSCFIQTGLGQLSASGQLTGAPLAVSTSSISLPPTTPPTSPPTAPPQPPGGPGGPGTPQQPPATPVLPVR